MTDRHEVHETEPMTKILFLPGAGGSASFWRPVADLTQFGSVLLAWPGLGIEPPAPGMDGLDDLVSMVLNQIDEPANIVAQSIGGLVAVKVALQEPEKVRRLVLVVTSAGVPVKELGGSDWQSEYYRAFPHAAAWVGRIHEDLSDQLAAIKVPTLLLWGDNDPISPLAVGERILSLLPDARLHVIRGGDHDVAQVHARVVANLIDQHFNDR